MNGDFFSSQDTKKNEIVFIWDERERKKSKINTNVKHQKHKRNDTQTHTHKYPLKIMLHTKRNEIAHTCMNRAREIYLFDAHFCLEMN